ncbi:unnamed protein product [Periconia digitata]|uniref:Uncharacterized protein n=1 Tax=Periconia digitata TaxID=1303443 RepID=A0A9W4UM07_9PLEO|nr:unnamed protein product [Periconia digitata]
MLERDFRKVAIPHTVQWHRTHISRSTQEVWKHINLDTFYHFPPRSKAFNKLFFPIAAILTQSNTHNTERSGDCDTVFEYRP